jgi:signal transduction histidine kinase
VEPSFTGQVSGLRVLVVTRWFPDAAGGPGFLLSVGVRLDHVEAMLATFDLPPGTRFALVRKTSGKAFELVVGDVAATRRLDVEVAVPGSGGLDAVVVGLPEVTMQAEGLRLLGLHLVSLLVAAAATMAAAGYVAQRHVVRHLHRLQARAVDRSGAADVRGAPREIVALAEAIDRRERDLRDAQAAGGFATWRMADDGRLELSPSFEDVVGRPPPAHVDGLVAMIDAADGERLLNALSDEGEAAPRSLEIRIPDRTGVARTLMLNVADVDRDSPWSHVGTIKDVTRERGLEHRLRDATARAEAASNAKSAFLAMMSHELRTPLNAICGFSDLMETQTFGPIQNERYREYLGDIRHSARHLVGIIDQVLDLARIEAGRAEPVLEAVAADEMLAAVERMLLEFAAERHGRIVREPAPGLVLDVDRRMLLQALVNLVANALRHGRDAQVTLRAEAIEGLGVRLVVEDDGPGVPLDVLLATMSPFGFDHDLVRDSATRIGFGLQITRGLVAAHAGHLHLSAIGADGRGTRVAVLLPPERVRSAGTLPRRSPAIPFDEVEPADPSPDPLASRRLGVMRLSAAGTVLACNPLERRFAGLGREEVVGRNFFREVAPCTVDTLLPARFARVADGRSAEEFVPCTFRLVKLGVRVLIRLTRDEDGTILMRIRWF